MEDNKYIPGKYAKSLDQVPDGSFKIDRNCQRVQLEESQLAALLAMIALAPGQAMTEAVAMEIARNIIKESKK